MISTSTGTVWRSTEATASSMVAPWSKVGTMTVATGVLMGRGAIWLEFGRNSTSHAG